MYCSCGAVVALAFTKTHVNNEDLTGRLYNVQGLTSKGGWSLFLSSLSFPFCYNILLFVLIIVVRMPPVRCWSAPYRWYVMCDEHIFRSAFSMSSNQCSTLWTSVVLCEVLVLVVQHSNSYPAWLIRRRFYNEQFCSPTSPFCCGQYYFGNCICLHRLRFYDAHWSLWHTRHKSISTSVAAELWKPLVWIL